MAQQTFRDLEREGWISRADAYADTFATITRQATEPILDTFGDLTGTQFLDVASGPGWLAAAASARGARATGVDFATTMVERAAATYPHVEFREGDAEQLPYPDASFDAVACAFGLLHVENPDCAIAEARRMVRAGGRYTFTVWRSPEQGGDFFRLVLGAIQRHGTLDVGLPPAPPIFRFSDPEECQRVLTAAGFVDPATRILHLSWQAKDPQDVLDLIYKSVVRLPMLLLAQSDRAREDIHRAILQGAEALRTPNGVKFEFPALLATARVE